ncbi:hypothetical protein CTI14_69545, partial [Methylobacterium radiotolerans]
MGQAVAGMLAISDWIAGFERASLVLPAFGAAALTLLTAGLLLADGAGGGRDAGDLGLDRRVRAGEPGAAGLRRR